MVLECSHLCNYFCTSNVFVTTALSFLPLDDVSIKIVRILSVIIKLPIYQFLFFYLISNIIPFLSLFFSFLAPYFSFNLSCLRHMLFFLSKTGVAFISHKQKSQFCIKIILSQKFHLTFPELFRKRISAVHFQMQTACRER